MSADKIKEAQQIETMNKWEMENLSHVWTFKLYLIILKTYNIDYIEFCEHNQHLVDTDLFFGYKLKQNKNINNNLECLNMKNDGLVYESITVCFITDQTGRSYIPTKTNPISVLYNMSNSDLLIGQIPF